MLARMETCLSPLKPRARKRARRLSALLASCALVHWRCTLEAWICEYALLDHVVDDERDGPRAAVTGLLRNMRAVAARPSDAEFAALLSDLTFLRYRISRSPAGCRPTPENAEDWNPRAIPLREFADADHSIAGYISALPSLAPGAIARDLLRALHRRQAQ